jgi:hypothetical protein
LTVDTNADALSEHPEKKRKELDRNDTRLPANIVWITLLAVILSGFLSVCSNQGKMSEWWVLFYPFSKKKKLKGLKY